MDDYVEALKARALLDRLVFLIGLLLIIAVGVILHVRNARNRDGADYLRTNDSDRVRRGDAFTRDLRLRVLLKSRRSPTIPLNLQCLNR